MELVTLTVALAGSTFAPVATALAEGGIAKGFTVCRRRGDQPQGHRRLDASSCAPTASAACCGAR
jgi:hypothetical protein